MINFDFYILIIANLYNQLITEIDLKLKIIWIKLIITKI